MRGKRKKLKFSLPDVGKTVKGNGLSYVYIKVTQSYWPFETYFILQMENCVFC